MKHKSFTDISFLLFFLCGIFISSSYALPDKENSEYLKLNSAVTDYMMKSKGDRPTAEYYSVKEPFSAKYFSVGNPNLMFLEISKWLNGVAVNPNYLLRRKGKPLTDAPDKGYTQPKGIPRMGDSHNYNGYIVLAKPPEEDPATAFHEAIHAYYYAINGGDDDNDDYEGPEFISVRYYGIVMYFKNNIDPALDRIIKNIKEGKLYQTELIRLKDNISECQKQVSTFGPQFFRILEKIGGKADFDGYLKAIDARIAEAEKEGVSNKGIKIDEITQLKNVKRGEEIKAKLIATVSGIPPEKRITAYVKSIWETKNGAKISSKDEKINLSNEKCVLAYGEGIKIERSGQYVWHVRILAEGYAPCESKADFQVGETGLRILLAKVYQKNDNIYAITGQYILEGIDIDEDVNMEYLSKIYNNRGSIAARKLNRSVVLEGRTSATGDIECNFDEEVEVAEPGEYQWEFNISGDSNKRTYQVDKITVIPFTVSKAQKPDKNLESESPNVLQKKALNKKASIILKEVIPKIGNPGQTFSLNVGYRIEGVQPDDNLTITTQNTVNGPDTLPFPEQKYSFSGSQIPDGTQTYQLFSEVKLRKKGDYTWDFVIDLPGFDPPKLARSLPFTVEDNKEEIRGTTESTPAIIPKTSWRLKDVKVSRPVHLLWDQTYYREASALHKASATHTARSWDKEDKYDWTLNFKWNEPPSVLGPGDSFSITFTGNAEASLREKCRYSGITYNWKGFNVTVNGKTVQEARDVTVGMPSTKEWVPSRSETATFTVPENASELAIYVCQTDDFVEFLYERKE